MEAELCQWCGSRPVKVFSSGRALNVCDVCYARRRRQLYYEKRYGKPFLASSENSQMCSKCGIRPRGGSRTGFTPYCVKCYAEMTRKRRVDKNSFYCIPSNYFHLSFENPERRKAFLKHYIRIRMSMKLCRQKNKDFDTVSCVWMDNILAEYEEKISQTKAI